MAPILLQVFNQTIPSLSQLPSFTQSLNAVASTVPGELVKAITSGEACNGSVATGFASVVVRGGTQAVHAIGGKGIIVIGALFPVGCLTAFFARKRRRDTYAAAPIPLNGYSQPVYASSYYPGSPPPPFVAPLSPLPVHKQTLYGPPAVVDPMTGYYTHRHAGPPPKHVRFGDTSMRYYR
ncbi:hypothetical protein BD324DRAFT_650897 [Kockovaella imperatae]|uniref:Transmembrane protein n=1 Tax=Kockovaella imperatae TaxID=4999 RepID=A0A1Y1UGY7_9TREE|nr:hypothetical protein BD324DRAFT_650897 [Kockovaella imperatae]ORX37292.1 hypothetical protein BD324DRAFT_650897 [Kockovaella imperatae]